MAIDQHERLFIEQGSMHVICPPNAIQFTFCSADQRHGSFRIFRYQLSPMFHKSVLNIYSRPILTVNNL